MDILGAILVDFSNFPKHVPDRHFGDTIDVIIDTRGVVRNMLIEVGLPAP